MKLFLRIGLLTLGVLLWAGMAATPAFAAGVVGTGSPASCESNDIAAALEDGGLVTFNCGGAPVVITSDTYVIEDDTTIRGNDLITLDGEDLRQQFIVQNGVTLSLEEIILLDGESAQGGCISVDVAGVLIAHKVTFQGCRNESASLGGGAVYNGGVFTATESLFVENRAESEGGAVLNRGRFYASFVRFEANTAAVNSGALENEVDGITVVNDSSFIGNMADTRGGAIGNTLSVPTTSGSIAIRRTLFIDNTTSSNGGAISNSSGTMSIENSTFVRNTSNAGGAIHGSSGTITTITFSTFSDNRADTGGAINAPLSQTGSVTLGYSIVAGSRNEADTTESLECDGPPLTSLGYNLIEDGSCVDGSNADDIRNTSPELGSLQDNGGFSQTLLPEATSPAVDKIPAAECTSVQNDQRGAKRMGTCDIGAVERGGLFVSAYMPRIFR